MRNFRATPFEMVSSLWRNRSLIHASTKREILSRYRGSGLGLLWSFFNPVLMLLVYTFVFSEVFKARWSTESESKTEFALVLFVGLIVFNIFAECIGRAPGLILSNSNYVKKVVFPLEILPSVALLAALYHGLISMGVWLGAYIILLGAPHGTTFLLPLVILPFIFFIIGLSWMLSSIGVFLRDISQFVGVFINITMFISPIFYPSSALPENFRYLLYMNPITPVIEMTRDVIFWGNAPDFKVLMIYWLVTSFIAWLGFICFQRTRKGFADVL